MDEGNFLFGLLILLAGRRLFWLFVGIMGFLAGMHFGLELFAGLNNMTVLLFSSCIGILGALVALGFQGAAIILAGFLGGGYFLMNILMFIGRGIESSWLIFLIGGFCGALIVTLVFDWALIGLTSLVGALLITQSLNMNESAEIILFIMCAVIGIIIQASLFTWGGNIKKDA